MMRYLQWGVLVLLVGCSGPATTAPVSGKVKYGDQYLLSGTIAFQSDDGRVANGNIQSDGSYSIPNAPIGNVKISVQTFPPPPSVLPPDAPLNSVPLGKHKFVPLPSKFSEFATSGLSYNVVTGGQTHNVEMNK